MRRVIGLTFAGLGAFLIVVAVFLPTYVAGHVIKYPLNEYLETTLKGSGVSYFSPSMVKEVSGATIRVTSTVKSDAAAGTSSTAVWNEFSYLYDVTNSAPFEFSSRRFAFDRRSAELVNCCGASIDGNKSIRQTGLVGFLWPMGTKKTTYEVFDPSLNKPRPARYTGTSTIDGIRVYRFVEHVAPTRSGSVTLPPSLVGMKGQSWVTLPEVYSGTNTFWVDPVTGAQLGTSENQKLVLEDTTGAQRLVLLDGSLVMTPQSVSKVVKLDRSGRSEYSLLVTVIPLVAGLVGLVLLIAGIVLVWLARGDQPDDAARTMSEPALDPAV
jgi:hypothetical protein